MIVVAPNHPGKRCRRLRANSFTLLAFAAVLLAGCEKHKPLAGAIVIIDAGHGGSDTGAPGAGISQDPEKTVVLAISNEVVRLLKARGVKAIASRTVDEFMELDARAALADRSRADLLVSIHTDAATSPDASGATLYIAAQESPPSRYAAEHILSALQRADVRCRGIKRQDFRVLVGHSRPAVLVECGFLTSAEDAKNLNTPSYQTRIAAAIAEGVAQYLGG